MRFTDGQQTTARILYDLPRSEYDAMRDRTNFTLLKKLGLESPLHYKHALDAGETGDGLEDKDSDEKQSDALLRGEAAHTAALEPDLYGGEDAEQLPETLDPINPPPPAPGRYLVFSGTRDERHKRYQAVLARAQLGRQKLITSSMHSFAQNVGRVVRASPAAAPYIVGGRREVTVTWDHEEPGAFELPGWSMPMKTRLDYVTGVALVDLKTAKSAKPEVFARQAWNLGYYAQAAIHIDAWKAATGAVFPYAWLVIEARAPFAVGVYEPSPAGIELGRQQYRDWLARLKVCRETDHYPAYAEGLLQLDPPKYALNLNDSLSEAA